MTFCQTGADMWLSEYLTPWNIYLHGITKILAYKKTQYQEMYILETGAYGKGLVLDGKSQSWTADEFLYHEPLVQPAMLCHGDPRRVLILGGGEGATIREVLRWQTVEKVVMVDIDAEVVAACREHLHQMHAHAFDDPRVELVIDDALNFLEKTSAEWDIIISDLSDPIESGPSFQLFTKEFFARIRRVLRPKGYFVVQAGSTAVAEMQLHATLARTVKEVFSYVQPYSSDVPTYGSSWGFILASDLPLPSLPAPEETDKMLAAKTTGGLRMLDGITLLGMFQVPAHIRRAIATGTQVYTLAEPPKSFGKGICEDAKISHDVGADMWLSEYMTPWDIYLHGVTKVLAYKKTQYQEMYIVETGAYGKGLVLDGKWQSSTVDEFIYHEPLVHPAMVCHGNPRRVLILGGGEGATIREVLRWQTVEKVVMVDIDGEVLAACREHLPEMHAYAFDDPRVELVIDDAMDFLEKTSAEWDIIISDLSDPIESGPSFPLFTKEFFAQIRKVLRPEGYFVVQAGPTAIAEIKLHASLARTVKEVFSYIQPYSSYVPTYGRPWGFILASERPFPSKPAPEETDRLLGAKTTGGLRMFDGITMLGMFQVQAHIRQAIATADQVYTLAEPPQFLGKGISSDDGEVKSS